MNRRRLRAYQGQSLHPLVQLSFSEMYREIGQKYGIAFPNPQNFRDPDNVRVVLHTLLQALDAKRSSGSVMLGAAATGYNDCWATPQRVYQAVKHRYGVQIDAMTCWAVAALWHGTAFDDILHYTACDDGLEQPWAQHLVEWSEATHRSVGSVFVAPPYAADILRALVKKCTVELEQGAPIVVMLKAEKYREFCHLPFQREIIYLSTRLKYGRFEYNNGQGTQPVTAVNPASYETMFVHFQPGWMEEPKVYHISEQEFVQAALTNAPGSDILTVTPVLRRTRGQRKTVPLTQVVTAIKNIRGERNDDDTKEQAEPNDSDIFSPA